jgi:hypothetical protein
MATEPSHCDCTFNCNKTLQLQSNILCNPTFQMYLSTSIHLFSGKYFTGNVEFFCQPWGWKHCNTSQWYSCIRNICLSYLEVSAWLPGSVCLATRKYLFSYQEVSVWLPGSVCLATRKYLFSYLEVSASTKILRNQAIMLTISKKTRQKTWRKKNLFYIVLSWPVVLGTEDDSGSLAPKFHI